MKRLQSPARVALTLTVGLAWILHAGCLQPKAEMGRTPVTKPASNLPATVGVIVSADQVTPASLRQWQDEGVRVALKLSTVANHQAERQAAVAIQGASLALDYFLEVGHCPELATSHPEWMASLQGHPEWRKQFPDVPQPAEGQVVKNYPWVPVLYAESSAAHVARIRELLDDKPAASQIWLNDLQGAPSACGCGHPLCRWTADYGPIKTATPLGDDAAARFVQQIRSVAAESKVIPIFVGECEAEDRDSVCCGVACFEGRCWKDFTRQLDCLAAESDVIGVGCFYKLFDRDLDRYAAEAGWVRFTLDSFSEMPAKREGSGVPTGRLVAILQGWDVTESEIQSQVDQAKRAGAGGWLVSLTPIDQSWKPVVVDVPDPAKR